MTLSTDFTDQIPDTMDFVKFTNNTVVVVAKETRELGREGFKLFLASAAFSCLFSFPLHVREGGGRKIPSCDKGDDGGL